MFAQFSEIADVKQNSFEINDFRVIFRHKLANSDDVICDIALFFVKSQQSCKIVVSYPKHIIAVYLIEVGKNSKMLQISKKNGGQNDVIF